MKLCLVFSFILLASRVAPAADVELSLESMSELARAAKSESISKEVRVSTLEKLKSEFQKKSVTQSNALVHAQAKFEIEQLEVFIKLEGCKSARELSESIRLGAQKYDPCIEGQQQPYQPGNKSIWDIGRALQTPGLKKDAFVKLAYTHAITDSVRNLLFLEIQESGVRWSSDEIRNRARLVIRENCQSCNTLEIDLITNHVVKSVMSDQKSGAIRFASLSVQGEALCQSLKSNGYDFSQVPLTVDATSPFYGTLSKTKIAVDKQLEERIRSIHKTLRSGRESLLLLTHAMTETKGEYPARVKLKCLKKEDNSQLIKSAYQEAEGKIKEFIKLIKPDLESLTKFAPRAVGEALYEDSSQVESVCGMIQKIQDSDALDETIEDVKLWGSIGVGAALIVTGIGAPAGATVLGTSVTLASLATGAAVGVGVGAHDWYASSVLKEDAELLDAAAIAAGNDPNLARSSREEWTRFENLRLSAMINLGMSAFDVAALARPLLKSGKGLKAVNESLERALSENRVKASITNQNMDENTARLIETDRYRKTLTLADVKLSDAKVHTRLKELGIHSIELPKMDYSTSSGLFDELKLGKFVPEGSTLEERSMMMRSSGLYQIRSEDIPENIGKSHPLELALKHPELSKYVSELEKKGYKFVIDSSLENSRMNAYFSWKKKLIAISENSKWSAFRHEFQHFEFKQGMDALGDVIGADAKLFDEATDFNKMIQMANREDPVFQQLRRDHPVLNDIIKQHQSTELTEHGLDETLAVQKELDLLKQHGYQKCDSVFINKRNYALDHQINELQKLKGEDGLSKLQQQTLIRAQLEKSFLKALKNKSAFGSAGAVVVVFSAATNQYLIVQGDDVAVVSIK